MEATQKASDIKGENRQNKKKQTVLVSKPFNDSHIHRFKLHERIFGFVCFVAILLIIILLVSHSSTPKSSSLNICNAESNESLLGDAATAIAEGKTYKLAQDASKIQG